MIPELRDKYNAEFSQDRYEALLRSISGKAGVPAGFRISETPLFLPGDFTASLVAASERIAARLESPEILKRGAAAVPEALRVPNEDEHPSFLQIDFAVASGGDGRPVPRLIELQGFASLYCFQHLFEKEMRSHFDIPESFTTYFNGLDPDAYVALLREVVLAGRDPENVVLLELEPERQKTRIDFSCTERLLGIRTVCVTDVVKRGRMLWYRDGVRDVPIHRVYNRVIFDELERARPRLAFRFQDDLDVSWAGHPNWYFRISKALLPYLDGPETPPAVVLAALDEYPTDLGSYVLKPLFSFAGAGVHIDVTRELLDSVAERDRYILQKKVDYAPVVRTPDGYAKAEIRMMYVWKERPLLINNLVRMSKGRMMGVAYNKDAAWVGSSLAYHAG